MESFKPPRKSVLGKYLTDPLLYLGVALVVIGISIVTLYKQDKSSIVQRVRFLKGNLQLASSDGKRAREETTEDTAESVGDGALAAKPSLPREPAAATPSAPAAAVVPAASKAAAPATSGPQVRIYYTEVPRAALEKIYEESQETGQFNSFGDYTAGILPDVAKRITSPLLKIRILDRTEKNMAKAQQIFTGIHDPETDEDIGLNTFIELAEAESNSFRGNIEVIRSWKEGGERAPASVQKNSFPAVFEMGPYAGFFIAGIMPRGPAGHGAPTPSEEEFTKQGPFQILKSQSFQNKETEFVIFVEFEKKP